MELWVRSQDKIRLIKTEHLIVGGTYENEIKEESDVFSTSLGTYKTKERALEVLDEIQHYMAKTLDSIIYQTDNCIVGCSTLVLYQMPKE